MPASEKIVSRFTFILAIVAGYCDTATFVGANGTFSAHVTGNFIVFAAQLARHADNLAWIKLITFPVFVLAVVIGGWLGAKHGKNSLLLWEGLLLATAGAGAFVLGDNLWYKSAVVMLIVFAMALQNALGRIFTSEVFGPTTVMTGHVTQAALDVRSLLLNKPGAAAQLKQSLNRQAILLGGFLAGCIAGGLITKHTGLVAVVLPGVVILGTAFLRRKKI